jgi:hypothetical protein
MDRDPIEMLFDYLDDVYGGNVFSVIPVNLAYTLTDIVREAASHGLTQTLPLAFYEDDDDPRADQGDYEIIVQVAPAGNWTVGVFADFPEG